MKVARESASSRPKPCASLKNAPGIFPVRHFLLALVGRKQTVVRDQLFPRKSPGSRLLFSRTRVQHSPDSSTIELPSALSKFGAYSPNSTCSNTLARTAAAYQAFRDSAPCLSRATTSRKAPHWNSEEAHLVNTTLDKPNRRRVSTDWLNLEDSQLATSLEGKSSPKPAGKTFRHSCPRTRFRRERARVVPPRYCSTAVDPL